MSGTRSSVCFALLLGAVRGERAGAGSRFTRRAAAGQAGLRDAR